MNASKQRPVIAWLTGLSGSGKSTIAGFAHRRLTELRYHAIVLDGDELRHGLNSDLGFSAADRSENVRRSAELAKLLGKAGLIVVVSLISPFRENRARARRIAGEVAFLEVFVDTPLTVCEARDPKGLYRQARTGAIQTFTGISSPYEAPLNPDLTLHTQSKQVAETVEPLVAELVRLSNKHI